MFDKFPWFPFFAGSLWHKGGFHARKGSIILFGHLNFPGHLFKVISLKAIDNTLKLKSVREPSNNNRNIKSHNINTCGHWSIYSGHVKISNFIKYISNETIQSGYFWTG